MKLIVIDMQKALLVDELYNSNKVISKIKKLISLARNNNIEVIYFKHDAGVGSGFSSGDEGFEIDKRIFPLNDEKVYIKNINSCFSNKDFCAYLEKENDKELMIVGLQTEFCIDATIKSGFEKGFHLYVPNGTNSTFDNEYMKAKVSVNYYFKWIWNDVFAKCISFQDALKMLANK